MKYKIIFNEYRDEYGVVTNSHYTIQIQRKFLFFKYWSTITHEISGWGDLYTTETNFRTLEDAKEFIENLNKSGVLDKWSQTVVDYNEI
jgi:hypothetical protein